MSFESSENGAASQVEAEHTLLAPKTIAEMGGLIHERLALLFSSAQINEFQTRLEEKGIELEQLGRLSEADSIEVSIKAADIFELNDVDRERAIEEIAHFIKSR